MARAEGGRLVTVKPAVSLETVFFKILEGQKPA
jgi:ABC-2 type transport system ATP-binding protein